MSFIQAINNCFHKYALFSGRARRSEFWFFSLFCTIVSTLLGFLPENLYFLTAIFSIATLIPSLAVSWRRMHDIGKAGAWSLIAFVPIVGFIIVLIWFCKDSQPGNNDYGPNPKKVGKDTIVNS